MVDSTNIKPLTGSALIQTIVPGAVAQDNDQPAGQLAGIPAGTLISGFVINRDRQSNPILRTEHGDVLVKSDVFLKTGSEVVIRVENIAAQARARIVRVDNQTIQELIQIQQNQAPIQDDVVLQPSIAQSATLKSLPPEQLATQLRQQPAVLLDAVLLKPASTPTLSPEALLSNVLKLPPDLARAVVSGQSVTLRIVSSDLNIATQPAAMGAPVSTAAAPPSGMPGITGQQYQAYSQQAMSGLARPTPMAPVPPSAPMPAPVASTSTPAPTTLTPAPTPLLAATVPASAAMPQPIATATMESLVAPPHLAATVVAPTATSPAPAVSTTVPPPAPTNPAAPVSQPGTAPLAVPAAPAAAPSPIAAAPTVPFTMPPESVGIIPTTQSIPMTIQSAAERPAQTGLMSAIVLGTESGGETVVRTPVGVMKLFTATPPPVGSTLQLEWAASGFSPTAQPLPITPSALPATEAPVSALASLGLHWDSLREAAELLQGQPQQLAELTARIPNTKSKLVNDVLFFVSALKSGDIRKWLGDKLTTSIEEKSPGLMQRLSNDFAALRAMTYDQTTSQQWQISTFPMMHEDELHQARLFVRQDEQQNRPGGQAGNGVRFLVECSLSQLGEMQLDGFVRKQDGKTGFDLVVRTQHPINAQMEADITALFHEGAQQTGYIGQIRFQQSLDHFVRPLQNITYQDGADDRSIIA